MKIFSPGQFSRHLLSIIPAELTAMREGLKIVAKGIQKTAKSEISHYQKSVGAFPAWAPLAESTVSQKESLGYSPPDNPLLRTGEYRDSIEYEVGALEAVIGSKLQKAAWFEFGTSKMPMRPVIGPAAFRNKKKIQKTLGIAVVSGFYQNGNRIHESLGYDFETQGE